MGLNPRNPVFRIFANNTGADQPAHPVSLISAFVIRLLESIISRLTTSEKSIFKLVFVAEQTGLNLTTLSETQKTGFVTTRPKWLGTNVPVVLAHVSGYHQMEILQRSHCHCRCHDFHQPLSCVSV